MFENRSNRERDLEEEIEAHLRLAEADGHTPESARRDFGNITLIREQAREIWGVNRMEDLMHDIRYAIRQLRKSSAFALTAIFSIALGIGGTTAMFTVIRAVLLKPLQYRDADRLVVSNGLTSVRYDETKTAVRSFDEIGDFLNGADNVALSVGASPEVLKEARVSANFLRILGVEPLVGRGFRAEEDTPGGPDVAMISADLWRHRFGGDPSIVGRTVTLATWAYTITGVLPPGFAFPFPGVDVWVTRPAEYINTTSPMLAAFGRLKPGVSIVQANAEWIVLKNQYAKAYPGMLDAKPGRVDSLTPMKDKLVTDVRSMLWMLFGAVGFVLLIACANVASLLLSRSAFRSRELAVRAALGAGRQRMVAQMLTESLLLGLAGGALGVLFAVLSLRGLASMTELNLPRIGEIHVDGMVLAFAVMLSVLTGVLFGLAPALGASRPDLIGVLRASGEGASPAGSRRVLRWFNLRGLLVVGQLALSVVLLIGATLLMESLARYRREDVGFNTTHLLTMRISLPPARYGTPRKTAAFHEELVRRIEAIPGVQAASVMFFVPMTTFAGMPIQDAAKPRLQLNQRIIATIQNVSPDYFRTMGIPLRHGREFTERDKLDAPLVVIVDERLAHDLWPDGADPVGRRVLLGMNPRSLEVVGLVGAVHQNLEIPGWPGIYRPDAQSPQLAVGFAVRTLGDPARFVNPIRKQVLSMDRDQPISEVKTMDELKDAELGQRRLILILLGSFAGTALLLALIGIYGVIAYSVAQRTRELGIRQVIGAQRSDILRHVLKQGLWLALTGVAAGIGGAYALTGVMKSLLFGVGATDPATFSAIAVLFVVVALAACYIPARRATRIDPMAALRVG